MKQGVRTDAMKRKASDASSAVVHVGSKWTKTLPEKLLPLHVGTAGFGQSTPHAIMRLRLDLSSGTLKLAGAPIRTEGESPGWLTRYVHDGRRVYVANEDCPGSLQAYSCAADGALAPIGAAVSTPGGRRA